MSLQSLLTLRAVLACFGFAVALAACPAARADDEEVLKQNAVLVKENRAAAMELLKGLCVECTPALPAGGTTLENNHALFIMNNYTFKLLAAKVGAEPVTSAPVVGTLLEQNHAILLQNREVMMSIVKKVGLTMDKPAELTGSLAEKNQQLLKGNKAVLAMLAEKMKK